MKKFLTALLCASLTVVLAFGFTACGNNEDGGETSTDPVNLVAITGQQVGVTDNVDYYVVSEPEASAKVNANADLNFVGDLQQLYGGEKGYPQAVIVAKSSLLSYGFLGEFLGAVEDNAKWLLDEKTSSESIVNAVQSHLTEGMAPKFTAKNLSKSVIKNCGINLTYPWKEDGKQEILSFMEQFNSVSDKGFGTPADSFFHDGSYGQDVYSGKISVYSPDGAPALGLAKLMSGAVTFEGVDAEYNVVDATLIQTYVTGANPAADVCVLPVNLAVKLLGSGENYKLVGTLTHGNLYIVSKNGTQITKENLNTLRGKTVGVVNLAAVPGLTFKTILKNNGIEYTEIV